MWSLFTKKEKIIFGIILFVILAIVATIDDRSRCKYSGCNEKIYKDNYCEDHYKFMQYMEAISRKSSSKKSNSSKSSNYSTTNKSSTSSTNNKTTNNKTTNNKTKSSTISHINGDDKYLYTDPEDYDNPDDFADDAWGIDFEEWDDAYDYWENY